MLKIIKKIIDLFKRIKCGCKSKCCESSCSTEPVQLPEINIDEVFEE